MAVLDKESPETELPDSAEAEPSPPSPQPAALTRPASKSDPEADKAAKRKEHLERALKAIGRTLDGKAAPKDVDADEGAEASDDEEKDEAKADEPDKDTPKRIELDKLKSAKHVRKAKEQLKAERETLDKERREHKEKVAEDARINAAADREYGDIARASVAYKAKDYRTFAGALKKLCNGDDFTKVARNVYEATKDGMGVADLRHEITELRARLDAKTDGESKDKAQTEAQSDEKRERAQFEKRTKSHGLSELADSELNDEAFKLYYDSWDDDLEEYALTAKQAADKVLQKEQRRAERITGRRIVSRETPARREPRERETREPAGAEKPYAEMNKEEKRKWGLDMALRKTASSKRARGG